MHTQKMEDGDWWRTWASPIEEHWDMIFRKFREI